MNAAEARFGLTLLWQEKDDAKLGLYRSGAYICGYCVFFSGWIGD